MELTAEMPFMILNIDAQNVIKKINYYKAETACDNCGTFYDWGNQEPKIVVTRIVEWR